MSKILAIRDGMAPELYAKLDKLATWLEARAKQEYEFAKDCRFITLKEASISDGNNYAATAKDIRLLLKKALSEQ